MKEATRNRAETVVLESYEMDGELSKLTVVSVGTVAVFIGAWALSCLASGFVAVDGPVGLVAGWLKAVIG